MIIEKRLIDSKIAKSKKNIFLLNNFPDSSKYEITDYISKLLNSDKSLTTYKINENYKDIDYEKINDGFSMFESGKLIFFYNLTLAKFKKNIKYSTENLYILFLSGKSPKYKEAEIIEFPKYIDINKIINDYFKKNELNIANDVSKYFSSFFIEYNNDIDKICFNIAQFMRQNNLKYVEKSIVDKFLFISTNTLYYKISDYLFKKNKEYFFHSYFTFIEEESFESFMYMLLSELKRLSSIVSLLKNNQDISGYFKDIGINYNLYRLKFDKNKINSFGIINLDKLFNLTLYCEFCIRRFNKNEVKSIFETNLISLFD